MVDVHIYVEGGGGTRAASSSCREGFAEFIGKVVPEGCRPRVVACGSREDAFKRFRFAVEESGLEPILLVDSEGTVTAGDAWAHLTAQDKWRRPPRAQKDSAYLMARSMEGWLAADPEIVGDYFRVRTDKAKMSGSIENKAPADLVRHFDRLSKNAGGNGYRKVEDGFGLLRRIRPAEVASAAPHANRFVSRLRLIAEPCTTSRKRSR